MWEFNLTRSFSRSFFTHAYKLFVYRTKLKQAKTVIKSFLNLVGVKENNKLHSATLWVST